MKNVREVREIPFVALLSPEERSLIKDQKKIPPELKDAADNLGVKKIGDSISFECSVGSIVFDIYDTVADRPKAPLALERENVKRQELATALDKDSFELPKDVKDKIEKALGDDNIWQKVKISVTYKVGKEKRYSQLSSAALDIFLDCRKALINLFDIK